MRETTGWRIKRRSGKSKEFYSKSIGDCEYRIHCARSMDDYRPVNWTVCVGAKTLPGKHRLLADAKRAAHRHAEGES